MARRRGQRDTPLDRKGAGRDEVEAARRSERHRKQVAAAIEGHSLWSAPELRDDSRRLDLDRRGVGRLGSARESASASASQREGRKQTEATCVQAETHGASLAGGDEQSVNRRRSRPASVYAAPVPGCVLVTGGAGFIGSHIVDLLIESGREVRVLDRLHPAAHDGRPAYINPAAEVRIGDVNDPDAVTAALAGVDAVCHQAAMVGLGTDFTETPDYVEANDLGTARLLAALASRRFRGPFVLASSMVVYGEGGYRCPRHGSVRPAPRARADLEAGRFEPPCPRCGNPLEPCAVPEDGPLDPRSVYAATKLQQEHLCGLFAREQRGVRFTALRYHNVYGPRMPRDTPYAGVASIFRSAIAAGRPPAVFEDGAQLRDFVHVSDVARANLTALDPDADAEGAFNIASGRPRSVGTMAELLAKAAGPEAPAPRVTGEFRLGDVRHVFADTSKAEAVLDFTAAVDLETGMQEFATAELR